MAIQGTSRFDTLIGQHGVSGLPPYPSGFVQRPEQTGLASIWAVLKARLDGGDPGIKHEMSNIERKHQYSNGNLRIASDAKAYGLFIELMMVFSQEFKEWEVQLDSQTSFDSNWARLQAVRDGLADFALVASWQKEGSGFLPVLKNLGAFARKPHPNTFPEIKAWFSNIEGGYYFSQITQLYLSKLDLCVLPHEVFACKNLKILQLCDNKLITFPYDLSAWPLLENLNLFGNRIRNFSTDLISPNNLKSLSLASNRIQTFRCDFRGFNELESLELHHNPFEIISCNLTSCKKLEQVSLTTDMTELLSIMLPPNVNLKKGSITNIVFEGCDFSLPALRALATFSIPMGYSLGICVNSLMEGVCERKGIFPFCLTGSSWKGRIPLLKEYKFVLIDSNRKVFLETRLNYRIAKLTVWDKLGPEIFEASDVQF